MQTTPFFNAHHSPVGAFATFTLGCRGPRGGLGLELAGPANEAVYVGLEEPDGSNTYRALPFYGASESGAADYDVEGHTDLRHATALVPFAEAQIERLMGAGIDTWRAGDLTFRIISPPRAVPDPDANDVREAVAPAVLVEITVDNTRSDQERRVFFGYRGSDRTAGMRVLDEPGLVGVGQGTSIAIATKERDVYAGLGWQPEAVLAPRLTQNLPFMLGSIGLLVGKVGPREKRTLTFAVGFFRDGAATTGIRTRYLYRRYFTRIEEVLSFALDHAGASVRDAEAFDQRLSSKLSPERAFMAAHTIRSYFGSTMLLEREDGRPLWVVHEGEYRMMNTFDLTVDQAFFELALNPWTVRNVLDLFVERYSYTDDARLPSDPTPRPGGLAFTHDMGVANAFSAPGRSGYEQAGLNGCFSYMSAEELMNWVLTACLYIRHTKDRAWARANQGTLLASLESLQNRDHFDTSKRNGLIGLDGARCEGGSEITTYDSLDASLGQARNNLYLGVKGWACYVLLSQVLRDLEASDAAGAAMEGARKVCATILGAADSEGLLPAVIGEGVDARIIPAIEGLVYPLIAHVPHDFAELTAALQGHFEQILRPGVCRFPDGGWRLSSTSRNSWLSKIYLCQFVSERLFGHEPDAAADRAHVAWLLDPDNAYFAWSDQMLEGKAVGSRYYPRGVTSVLWLSKGDDPIAEIAGVLAGSNVAVESA